MNTLRTHNGNITTCCTNNIRTYQIPFCGRTNSTTNEGLRRSNSCPRISPIMHGQMTQEQILWIQTRPISLARHSEPQNQVPQEDGSQMQRTLPNLQSPWTSYLLARTSSDMANPQCFPCSAPYALHQKQSSWTQLPLTTSRHRK